MSKRKNKENDIILETLGGSSDDVTGSCWSVSYPKKDGLRGTILIEMGMIQRNSTILEEYNLNKNMINKIPIKEAEFVFIAHSHCDHIGNLPALISNGFQGRVITTKENYEISKKLLQDASYIHQRNIEYLRGKGSKVKPLYSDVDTYELFDRMDVYEDNIIHELNEYISIRYVNNSHVVGAKQLELFIKAPSSVVKKILYTSDLGSPMNKEFQPFLRDNHIVTKASVCIFESTYGNSTRSFNKKDAITERKEMISLITEQIKNENRVFIPCFSYGRTQNMMVWLYENFKDKSWFNVPVIVDSKLANEINVVYTKILKGSDLAYWKEVMAWDKFKFIKDYQSTMSVLGKRIPMVALSSSGMISAGHSLMYARSFISDKRDMIIFCGYCGEGTIGSKILDGTQKTITIDGVVCRKACKIKRFNTWSSHAQQKDLIDYMKQINCNKIILHHGSKDSKEELRDEVKKQLNDVNKTTKVVIVEKGYQTILD